MTLKIITGTKQEWDASLPASSAEMDISSYYVDKLQSAESESKSTISFRSAAPQQSQSDHFSLIGEIERTILSYMAEHDCPQDVVIVCDSDDTARLYKVVYNFWFAEDKPSRMDDNSWD